MPDDNEWIRRAGAARAARNEEERARADAEARKEASYREQVTTLWEGIESAIKDLIAAYNDAAKRPVIELQEPTPGGMPGLRAINLTVKDSNARFHMRVGSSTKEYLATDVRPPGPIDPDERINRRGERNYPLEMGTDGRVRPEGLPAEPGALVRKLMEDWVTAISTE